MRYHGAGDVVLSAIGKAQLAALVPVLVEGLCAVTTPSTVGIVASPMARALESAAILHAGVVEHGVEPVAFDGGRCDAPGLLRPQPGSQMPPSPRVGSSVAPAVRDGVTPGLATFRSLQSHAMAVHPDFAEISFGRFEGLTASEIEATDPQFFAAWKAEQVEGFPDGEPFAEFTRRVRAALAQILASTCVDDLVLVAHRGIVSRALQSLLEPDGDTPQGGDPRWAVELGSVSLVKRADDGPASMWRVEVVNRTGAAPGS